MLYRRTWIVTAILLVIFSSALTLPVAAASWTAVRDAAMTLRERGNAEEAYRTVMGVAPSDAKELVDRNFLAGFLAFRSLGRADLAMTHFQAMALGVSDLPSHLQSDARSQAGYWLGRVLTSLGRTDQANQMYAAAAAYRDTFYGQMAASQLGLTNTASILAGYRQYYPNMDIFWHDPRVRKELVLAIIKAESSFRVTAQSGAGAKGLMQIMDGTAMATGRLAGINIDLRQVATNGHYNVAVGSKIVGDLMQDFNGNVLLMASGYNAGPQKPVEWIRRFGDPRGGQIDPVDWVELVPFAETRSYIKKIVSNYVTYLALSAAGV